MKKLLLVVTLLLSGFAAYSYENTYAVVVAVADYKNFSTEKGDLNYTINDAKKFYEFLETVDDPVRGGGLQGLAVLVTPGNAAGATTCGAAHLQVEDGVADDQCFFRPRAHALQGQEGDVRCGFGMGDIFVGDDG